MNQKLGRRRLHAFDKQERSRATAQSDIGGSETNKKIKSLFHYTTAAGLIGIITTQTLWATHANFLNDSAECQLLNRLLTPQIEKEFAGLIPRLTKVGASNQS